MNLKFSKHEDIRSLGSNLEMLAQQVVEGFIVGMHRKPVPRLFCGVCRTPPLQHGVILPGILTGKVYGQYRKTVRSNDMRKKPIFAARLLLTLPLTMYYPYDKKIPGSTGMSTSCASLPRPAVLMNILRKQRDAFGLTLFDEDIRFKSAAKSSTIHYRLLLSKLTELIENPQLNRRTRLAESLHQIAESIHRRSLVVVFSDVMESPEHAEEVFAALQHLRYAKHEVIFFHVTDKKRELDFEFENRPYVFVDMETGEEVKLQPNQVKDFYTQQVKSFTEQLRMKCLQFKIDFVEADINEGFVPILQTWMTKRTKMG
jgi:hypothetical protein